MNGLKTLMPQTQNALSHLMLRTLCLLIVEHECARLVQQSSGTPAVMGNYLLASLFCVGLLMCLFNVKAGLMIGIIAAGINILAKIMVIFGGHEHFPYYPIVWITQCVLVGYFCLKAYTLEGRRRRTRDPQFNDAPA